MLQSDLYLFCQASVTMNHVESKFVKFVMEKTLHFMESLKKIETDPHEHVHCILIFDKNVK